MASSSSKDLWLQAQHIVFLASRGALSSGGSGPVVYEQRLSLGSIAHPALATLGHPRSTRSSLAVEKAPGTLLATALSSREGSQAQAKGDEAGHWWIWPLRLGGAGQAPLAKPREALVRHHLSPSLSQLELTIVYPRKALVRHHLSPPPLISTWSPVYPEVQCIRRKSLGQPPCPPSRSVATRQVTLLTRWLTAANDFVEAWLTAAN